jgi:C4-dicarboxylate-specific signal transduction histidine kinase
MGMQKFDFGESAVIIAVDITVQKVLEAQIEMDRRNSFNSAKLSALGEMAAGIAHEINNPLAIIQGSASNLLTDIREGKIVPAKIEKALQRVDRTVDRAVKIINSLRTFARDGTTEPFESTSISKIIEETLEFCRTRFFNSKIDLRTPMVESDIKIFARPIQISQVLLNLLNNAYDAIVGSDKPWVEVSVVTTTTEIKLIVTDSGPGIPPEVAAKIMQPFFTTKPPGKGTGLGLSISHSIIKDHHGVLSIDSNFPNTRFIVSFPSKSEQIEPANNSLKGNNQAA